MDYILDKTDKLWSKKEDSKISCYKILLRLLFVIFLTIFGILLILILFIFLVLVIIQQ